MAESSIPLRKIHKPNYNVGKVYKGKWSRKAKKQIKMYVWPLYKNKN